MIKNLQIKFILITMSVIIATTGLIYGIVVFAHYQIINRQIDSIINLIVENNGVIPEYRNTLDNNFFTRETKYSTRYFTAKVDTSGKISDINTQYIASVSIDEATEMVQNIISKPVKSGFYDNYKFKKVSKDDYVFIVFLDSTIQLRSHEITTIESLEIVFFIWLLIFIIITATSKRVLRPLLANFEQQKQFITNAGHELKTPLAVIDADIDVLEMTVGEDNEWIESIKNQTSRLNLLIKNLLSLANMEEEKKNLTVSEFSLSETLEGCINDFKALTQNKNVEFNKDIKVSIVADQSMIKQLITILLDNSIKYTPDDGTIKITAERHGKTTKFEIANTCENVESINTEKLFDRFYRGDESRNKKKEGYGIGLSIAKTIVDMHKGKINAYVTKDGMISFRVII